VRRGDQITARPRSKVARYRRFEIDLGLRHACKL
jgi:hypothetical protein